LVILSIVSTGARRNPHWGIGAKKIDHRNFSGIDAPLPDLTMARLSEIPRSTPPDYPLRQAGS
jgi:hypothetical protein